MVDSPPLLSAEQRASVEHLAGSLGREQAIWLSGYFAGLARVAAAPSAAAAPAAGAPAAPGAPAPAAPAQAPAARTVSILYATETGNGKDLATTLAAAAEAKGVSATATDLADYKPRALKDEQDLLVITSTHGEGDPPETALEFFEFLEGRKAPKLPELRFAVLALGDSTYEHYCAAGRRVDARLEALGTSRITDRVDCDVDYEDAAAAWSDAVLAALVASLPAAAPAPGGAPAPGTPGAPGRPGAPTTNGTPATNGTAPAATTYNKRNPFAAPLLENVVLTGRGSTKQTRHVELSLEDSGLTYEPGDAIGVVARNDPALVDALLQSLNLDADAPVTVKNEPARLGDALTDTYEITAATPRLLDHWATLTGSDHLRALGTAEEAAARLAFLHDHHVIDVVERFPAPGIDADQFLAGLRPLQPRLYSVASSLAAAPDEAHLTVSTVRYTLHDRPRTGVASGHLAALGDAEATVGVYVQPNETFRLPADDVPIIMVGAGTGVAPYRAFMQDREARGVTGRAWLIFGERNFRSDFLYQVEWQDHLKQGTLDRLDLAFSRDGDTKTYVQHKLLQAGRDVYAWLEDGAVLYVCGDAAQMAPDVHDALATIVAEHGGLDTEGANEYLAALKRDRRYRLDVY